MKKIPYLFLFFLIFTFPLSAKEEQRTSQTVLFQEIAMEKTKEAKLAMADEVFKRVKNNILNIIAYWEVLERNPEYKKNFQKHLDYYLALYEVQAFMPPYKKSEVIKLLKKKEFQNKAITPLILFEEKVNSMIQMGKL